MKKWYGSYVGGGRRPTDDELSWAVEAVGGGERERERKRRRRERREKSARRGLHVECVRSLCLEAAQPHTSAKREKWPLRILDRPRTDGPPCSRPFLLHAPTIFTAPSQASLINAGTMRNKMNNDDW
jgi:hypothetical protein